MTRPLSEPRPGYFKLRLVRGGPFVPAEIRHEPAIDPETGGIMEERSYHWRVMINGRQIEEPSPDPLKAGVFRVWESGVEIDETDFNHMSETADWCSQYARHEPPANPKKSIDLRKLPPDYFLPRK